VRSCSEATRHNAKDGQVERGQEERERKIAVFDFRAGEDVTDTTSYSSACSMQHIDCKIAINSYYNMHVS
jgi:hypothetical protein